MYLKTILKEIGHYNTKNPHKNMWELKPEYRHYSSKSDEGGEKQASDWLEQEKGMKFFWKKSQRRINWEMTSLYGDRFRSKQLDSLKQFVDKI